MLWYTVAGYLYSIMYIHFTEIRKARKIARQFLRLGIV